MERNNTHQISQLLTRLNQYKLDERGNTPLHLAAQYGDLNAVRALVGNNTELMEIKNAYGSTPLHSAVWYGPLEIIKYLVSKGADLTTRDSYGHTLLHAAAQNNHLKLINYLISEGADLAARDNNGNTPLHLAARNANIRVVRLLADQGADLEAQDNEWGNTPLHVAVNTGFDGVSVNQPYMDLIKYLVEEKKVNLAAVNRDNYTPLHLAVDKTAVDENNIELVKYLVEQGSNLEATDMGGYTPLHLATLNASLELMKYLVEQGGSDLEAVDIDGCTPLHIAVDRTVVDEDNIELVKYLVEQGSNLAATDLVGYTPLHLAALSGDLELVDYLVEQGADLTAKNGEGSTVLDILAEYRVLSPEIATYLAKKETNAHSIDLANNSNHIDGLSRQEHHGETDYSNPESKRAVSNRHPIEPRVHDVSFPELESDPIANYSGQSTSSTSSRLELASFFAKPSPFTPALPKAASMQLSMNHSRMPSSDMSLGSVNNTNGTLLLAGLVASKITGKRQQRDNNFFKEKEGTNLELGDHIIEAIARFPASLTLLSAHVSNNTFKR